MPNMSPYARFGAISALLTTSVLVAVLLGLAPIWTPWLAAAMSTSTGLIMLAGAGLGLLIAWGVLALLIMPAVLRLPGLRQLILGRHHIEGTWIEAVRGGKSGPRLAVLTIKPAGNGFCVSGTTLLRTGEAQRSWRMAFGSFNGQILEYKFDVTLSSEASDAAGGVGEIQFETTGGATKRYAGGRNSMDGERVSVEGVRLTSWRARRRLKRADTRSEIVNAYWAQFFEAHLPKLDRKEARNGSDATKTDDKWRKTDATPTADKIRKVSETTTPTGRA